MTIHVVQSDYGNLQPDDLEKQRRAISKKDEEELCNKIKLCCCIMMMLIFCVHLIAFFVIIAINYDDLFAPGSYEYKSGSGN